ncbi:hypothetical protein VTJ04DRAFT_452 [Mycothermus thermophilus]|uniref:uncharacterized protein n=1 Tax=Humicola insolens TaxID=85995 RepID=UPI003743C956
MASLNRPVQHSHTALALTSWSQGLGRHRSGKLGHHHPHRLPLPLPLSGAERPSAEQPTGSSKQKKAFEHALHIGIQKVLGRKTDDTHKDTEDSIQETKNRSVQSVISIPPIHTKPGHTSDPIQSIRWS